jgi:CBS domain-containing protein
MISTVRQILQYKSSEVWSVTPETTIFEALQLMAEKDIGAVLVMKDDELVGIFSERDYARQAVLHKETIKYLPVKELMTREVFRVSPEQTVQDCMVLMTAHHFRHLPVVENGKVIGIITIGDVVKSVIADQNLLLEEMQNYISGRYGR